MGAADPTKESRHDHRPRRLRAAPQPHPRPTTSSTNSSSMATVPSRTSPIPAAPRSATSSPAAIADIFDALVAALADTRLEPDLEDLLWSTVNVFHRAIDRIERELDDNELAQQRVAARTGRQRGQVRRAGTPDGGGPDADRTPQRLRADARPGRRPVRAPHPLSLAAAQRVEGQPSQPDLGDDRQPRLPRREEARRQPGAPARRARRSPSPAGSTSTITG